MQGNWLRGKNKTTHFHVVAHHLIHGTGLYGTKCRSKSVLHTTTESMKSGSSSNSSYHNKLNDYLTETKQLNGQMCLKIQSQLPWEICDNNNIKKVIIIIFEKGDPQKILLFNKLPKPITKNFVWLNSECERSNLAKG